MPIPDQRERERRDGELAQLVKQGIPPSAIWLRFLSDLRLAPGDMGLYAVGARFGADPGLLLDTWHLELADAIRVAEQVGAPGTDPATLIAVREGPRIALLLLPQPAYDAALAPFRRRTLSRWRAARRYLRLRRTA